MTGGAVELLYDNARYENFSKCLFLKLDSESKKKNYTRYPNWLLRYFIIYSGKYLEACNKITKLWKMITIFSDSEFLQRDCRQAWVPNKIPY